MLDFDKGVEQWSVYLGSEKKTALIYEGELYMLKYPDPVRGNKLVGHLSYKNNQYSEHIGSNIFRLCGFETQETYLGYWTDNKGKRKIVVACKDFTQNGGKLIEAKTISNQTLVDKGKSTLTIEDVYGSINESHLIPNKKQVIDNFWDMFVIDALIGNGDRHLGNWGFLVNGEDVKFAPIYDCGSSLSALLSDQEMAETINSNLFKNQTYNRTSCYSMNDKRIFYHEIFKVPPQDLAQAIKRTVPKIDMTKIHAFVDDTPTMSDIRKDYGCVEKRLITCKIHQKML